MTKRAAFRLSEGFNVDTAMAFYDTNSYAAFSTTQGVIVVVECDDMGRIAHYSRVWQYQPTVVICCYPAMAKQRNPSLPIYGSWSGQTVFYDKGGFLYVEEDDAQ